MSGTGTRDFLNTLRVAGRLWGSHGDKLTSAAQGRNYDDEVYARKTNRSSGGTPTSREDSSPRPPSPGTAAFVRQFSYHDAPLPPGLSRQGSSEAGGTPRPSISPVPSVMRQSSRDFPPTPPMMSRQNSREVTSSPLSSYDGVLRQSSRSDLAPSPVQFRPIGGGREAPSSPVAFLATPPSTMAPIAVRPQASTPTSSTRAIPITATSFSSITSSSNSNSAPNTPTAVRPSPAPLSSSFNATHSTLSSFSPGTPTSSLSSSTTKISRGAMQSTVPLFVRQASSDFAPIATILPLSLLEHERKEMAARDHTTVELHAATKAVMSSTITITSSTTITTSTTSSSNTVVRPIPSLPVVPESTSPTPPDPKAPLSQKEKEDLVRRSHRRGKSIKSGSSSATSFGSSSSSTSAFWQPGHYLSMGMNLLMSGPPKSSPPSSQGPAAKSEVETKSTPSGA